MHIILSLLGIVVTILILVNRLSENGIDIGWLNPFAWRRRRDWSKKFHVNPIYAITSPMEVTALIMIALVKSEGEISREQKAELLTQFTNEFKLSSEQAAELLSSCLFILKDDIDQVLDIRKLLAPNKEGFSSDQAESALSLLKHMAELDGQRNSFQQKMIESFAQSFNLQQQSSEKWN